MVNNQVIRPLDTQRVLCYIVVIELNAILRDDRREFIREEFLLTAAFDETHIHLHLHHEIVVNVVLEGRVEPVLRLLFNILGDILLDDGNDRIVVAETLRVAILAELLGNRHFDTLLNLHHEQFFG